jgi:OOP family OmpA-OmpF porin
MTRHLMPLFLASALLLGSGPLAAAPGDQPVQPLPPSAQRGDDKERVRTTALPARGLFIGDKLSESARRQLAELTADARDLNVEVALLVPTGPWQIDGSGAAERDLTPARLQSVRRFLAERGIDAHRIFVESRVDERLTEPQLTVQLLGRPASD